MAKLKIQIPTAVASIAVLLALAAVPSQVMAQDRGQSRWQGGDRGAATAQSQPRQESRSNRASRSDNGQAQRRVATPRQAVPQQRNAAVQPRARAEQSASRSGRRAETERRAVPEQRAVQTSRRDDRRAAAQQDNRARNERVRNEARRAPAANSRSVAKARRDGSWRDNNNNREARRDNIRRDNDRNIRRDNDRNIRRDNDRSRNDRGSAWKGNDRQRYANAPRRDDDRRWSYSNGRYHWNRDWRRDNRYDWHNHRRTYRSLYNPGYYRVPYSGYYYRPMLVGHYLSSGFYGNSYWISDPWEYRLPGAYGPYRWIRYFDDVLLVNIHTGMVVDVIHDFFW